MIGYQTRYLCDPWCDPPLQCFASWGARRLHFLRYSAVHDPSQYCRKDHICTDRRSTSHHRVESMVPPLDLRLLLFPQYHLLQHPPFDWCRISIAALQTKWI